MSHARRRLIITEIMMMNYMTSKAVSRASYFGRRALHDNVLYWCNQVQYIRPEPWGQLFRYNYSCVRPLLKVRTADFLDSTGIILQPFRRGCVKHCMFSVSLSVFLGSYAKRIFLNVWTWRTGFAFTANWLSNNCEVSQVTGSLTNNKPSCR